MPFQEGMAHNKSGVTPLSLVAPITHRFDLSNEVHNVSEFPLVPKIPDVKLEQLKKMSVLALSTKLIIQL